MGVISVSIPTDIMMIVRLAHNSSIMTCGILSLFCRDVENCVAMQVDLDQGAGTFGPRFRREQVYVIHCIR